MPLTGYMNSWLSCTESISFWPKRAGVSTKSSESQTSRAPLYPQAAVQCFGPCPCASQLQYFWTFLKYFLQHWIKITIFIYKCVEFLNYKQYSVFRTMIHIVYNVCSWQRLWPDQRQQSRWRWSCSSLVGGPVWQGGGELTQLVVWMIQRGDIE